jgi:hypothetical protein
VAEPAQLEGEIQDRAQEIVVALGRGLRVTRGDVEWLLGELDSERRERNRLSDELKAAVAQAGLMAKATPMFKAALAYMKALDEDSHDLLVDEVLAVQDELRAALGAPEDAGEGDSE